jgi:putative ABC transport system substrate-binding protein
MMGKGLQILKEVAPNISRLAILGTDYPGSGMRAAAEDLKITVFEHPTANVRSADEFDAILSKMMEERADAVFFAGDFTNIKYRNLALEFFSKNRLPSMFEEPPWVERSEGLLSYFTDIAELRRRAAYFVDKIFKGAKPADLPVEQPTRFKLVISLKVAKALGLTVPQSVLQRADAVFE